MADRRLALFAQLAQDAFRFLEDRGYRLIENKTLFDRGAQLIYATATRYVMLNYDSLDGCIDVDLGALPHEQRLHTASLYEILGLSMAAYAADKLPAVVQRVAAVLAENTDLLDTDLPTPEVTAYRTELTRYYSGARKDLPHPIKRNRG